jgi:hypothetical protein
MGPWSYPETIAGMNLISALHRPQMSILRRNQANCAGLPLRSARSCHANHDRNRGQRNPTRQHFPETIRSASPIVRAMRTMSVRILFHGRESHTNRGEKFLVVEWLGEECGCPSIQRGGTDQRVLLSGKDDHSRGRRNLT